MIPRPVWQAPYERGLAHLRAEAMDKALQAFDEACDLSDGAVRPLRSRTEVVEMLKAVQAACVVEGTGAEDKLENEQVKDARLFDMLSRLPSRIQAVILDPSPVSSDDPDLDMIRRAIQLAEVLLSSLLADRNLIDFLPTEILIAIGQLAVEDVGSSDVALALSQVSQRWRSIMTEVKDLWGLVHLNGSSLRAVVAKAETFLGKGPIRALVFDYECEPGDANEGPDLDILYGQVHGLLSLRIRTPVEHHYHVFNLVQDSDKLASIVIHMPARQHPDIAPTYLPSMQLRSVRRLEILQLPHSSHTGARPTSLADLVSLLPKLEDLVIDHSACTLAPVDATVITRLTLPEMRRLTLLTGEGVAQSGFRSSRIVLSLPKLESLDLTGSIGESYTNLLFPTRLVSPNTQHLTQFILRGSSVNEPVLVGHLPYFDALVHLDVRETAVSDLLIRALSHPDKGQPGVRLCPVLEVLRLDTREEDVLQGVQLDLLVKSRQDVKLKIRRRWV